MKSAIQFNELAKSLGPTYWYHCYIPGEVGTPSPIDSLDSITVGPFFSPSSAPVYNVQDDTHHLPVSRLDFSTAYGYRYVHALNAVCVGFNNGQSSYHGNMGKPELAIVVPDGKWICGFEKLGFVSDALDRIVVKLSDNSTLGAEVTNHYEYEKNIIQFFINYFL